MSQSQQSQHQAHKSPRQVAKEKRMVQNERRKQYRREASFSKKVGWGLTKVFAVAGAMVILPGAFNSIKEGVQTGNWEKGYVDGGTFWGVKSHVKLVDCFAYAISVFSEDQPNTDVFESKNKEDSYQGVLPELNSDGEFFTPNDKAPNFDEFNYE